MGVIRYASLLLVVPAALCTGLDCAASASNVGVNLSTSEGQELLRTATHAAAFWRLSLHFTTELPGQCGPASATMMLNALGVPAPVSRMYSKPEYNFTTHYWEQENVHESSCVEAATKPYNGSIEQVSSFVSCRGVGVQVFRAASSSAAVFRQSLKEAFAGSGLVAVNFARRFVGQIPAIGHHSPVGAYDETSDRVLIMDVARYKYPPVWHCLDTLFHAMADSDVPDPGFNITTPRGWWTTAMVSAPAAAGAVDRILV